MNARSIAKALVALALLVPGGAGAGTAEEPEIVDHANDAQHPTLVGTAPEADITAIWFTTLRDDEGAASGLEVHLTTVEPVEPGEGAGFTVYWDAVGGHDDAACWGALDWDVLPSSWGGPTSQLNLSCNDGNTISLLDLIEITMHSSAPYATGLTYQGTHYVVTVDFSLLPEEVAARHAEGALLTSIYGVSRVLWDDAVLAIHGGGCVDIAPALGCNLVVAGSPESTATYQIGT